MPTIGLGHTLNDLRNILKPDGSVDRVLEILSQDNPIMQHAIWTEGDLPTGNKTTVRASLPSPSIRRINRGVAATKGTTKQIIDVCMSLEDRSVIDVELLRGKPNPQAYRAAEDDAHVEGMAQYVAAMMLYGDLSNEPDTINGFMARYNTLTGAKGTPGYQVINANLAAQSGDTNTSMLIVDWGADRVSGIYPRNTQAGLRTKDLGISDVEDSNGNEYQAMKTLYHWDWGLAVHNVRSVARVANINAAGLGNLSAAQQTSLVDKIVYAKNVLWKPKAPKMYVSDSLYTFLEIYLTHKDNVHITRQDLANAESVLRFDGIPVFKMDCMADTEAVVQ